MNQQYREFDIEHDTKLNEIRDEVITAIQNTSVFNGKVPGIHGDELQSLKTKLVNLEIELAVCNAQAEVIKSLY